MFSLINYLKFHILLIIALLTSNISVGQTNHKIKNKIICSVRNWPDTNKYVVSWYVDEKQGILLSFPSFENDKDITLLEILIKEKNNKAIISRDSQNKFAYYIRPLAKKIPNGGNIDLEIWVKFNHTNLLIPVPIDDKPVYDLNGNVIPDNVKWKEYVNEDGKFLIYEMSIYVKPKRIKTSK